MASIFKAMRGRLDAEGWMDEEILGLLTKAEQNIAAWEPQN